MKNYTHWGTRFAVAMLSLVAAMGCSGCLVAGYSSSGGGFIWPGGLGLLVVILVVVFLLRRGR